MTLGSVGGTGNDGGSIDTSFTGGFQSAGDHSPTLVEQSIGAGGGFELVSGDDAPQITLGGSAGAQGDGGDITIVNDGTILTQGDGSHGAVLQTIGGGGGAVFGDFTNPELTLNTDNSGDGGDIDYTQNGDIATLGDGAFGIIAQTLGGGGGFVDGLFAGNAGGTGTPGSISLDVAGSVQTEGDGSNAVLMQSIGGGIGGDIDYSQAGDIITLGDDSIGIIAQSLGGTGGWVGGNFARGNRHRHRGLAHVRRHRLNPDPGRRLAWRAAADHRRRRRRQHRLYAGRRCRHRGRWRHRHHRAKLRWRRRLHRRQFRQ